MIRTTSLRFAYKNTKTNTFYFPDIDLSFEQNALILGDSGIGKTTLLHIMAGLLVPKKGNVFIGNTCVQQLTRNQLNNFRGKHIGIIFQRAYFIKSLSLLENIKIREKLSKKTIDQERRIGLIEKLDLMNVRNKKVQELSEGQRQRLSIALGIIHKPKVILADEPTSNLDDKNCERVISLLKKEAQICKSNLVIITHDQRVKPHFDKHIIL
ncbi:ATP-binding cassette domain-containing protein [Aquimarina sp. MMG015]|uniref:ABC transporter ATP-binding protein n=1 Tax=unclassified Aquimarina TaxID=2627091 RepID=UPI000E5360A7|nr:MULTISPECIES: ATP-binding cassette domain-containing protein [unclassified Aquimarina]AXT54524.1 ATP-binding cassette domain-containing protein [Aquimarina sp. AD1]MBQ4804624.1 ATP-binding cassette domain-containing protein [Aquimarina sp. MMG015]RKN20213.1 ATP-binding cassette domain-containing protein [Aquimarina sp. AD1]